MQFYGLLQNVLPFDLEPLRPARIKPLVRSNGSYNLMQDKAYLFEAAVGPGKLLASAFGLAPADRPERRFLLGLLLKYGSGEQFAPRDKLPPEILRKYLRAASKAK